jgi:hypothetical protein
VDLVDCLHQIEFAWVVELELRRSLWRATPLHLATPYAILGRPAQAKQHVGQGDLLDWPVPKTRTLSQIYRLVSSRL